MKKILMLSVLCVLAFGGEKPRETNIDDLEIIARNLPKGTLRANVFTVLGAEAAGAGEELNKILSFYAKKKMEELENKTGA